MRSLLLGLLIALAAPACTKSSSSSAPSSQDEAKVDDRVTAPELADWVAHGACKAVDANGPGTRANMGVIPGAILLSDYRQYDVSELPADHATRLVFYCANTECGASHAAAARAVAAGYRDVRVFKGGIAGWKNAGNPTQAM